MNNTLGKIAALDIGDQWIGVALSDSLRIVATPYTTIAAHTLEQFLHELFHTQQITTVVVGYPKTMKGSHSQQTEKVIATTQALQKQFPWQEFILWDERLSSKRAETISSFKSPSKRTTDKAEKLKSHARAAAFILDSYLLFLSTRQHDQLQ